MMKRVSPLSAKLSMAHLRAFLLLLEKSRATPIFLSFTISVVFWCCFFFFFEALFYEKGDQCDWNENVREETTRTRVALELAMLGQASHGNKEQFLCKVDVERDIASPPSTCTDYSPTGLRITVQSTWKLDSNGPYVPVFPYQSWQIDLKWK